MDINELVGKSVELGTAETIYFGTLVEVNEEDIYLQSESGWIVVPVEKVAYIRQHDED